MAKCSCGSDWSGSNICHCSQCHYTFSTPENFDAHRVPLNPGSGRTPAWGSLKRCEDPVTLGLVQNDRGTWRKVDEGDVTQWLKRG